MKLRHSNYNIFFNINNKEYVFNALNCELAEIDPMIKRSLESHCISDICNSDITDLLEGGFVLPKGINEHENYMNLFDEKKNEKSLSIKLLLATSCNSDCIYCYQSLASYNSELINVKQIDVIGKWISNEIENNQIKDVNIELFGGEPLLAKSIIPKLYELLSEIVRKHSIKLTTAIITNATLLSDDLIKIFIENDVEMKITIDGVGDKHNRRRKLKGSKKDGYEIVFNSLKNIIKAGGVDLIGIRMNVDKLNIEEVEAVAIELHKLGIKKFYCGRVLFRGKNTDYDKNLIAEIDYDKEIDLKLFYIFQKYGFANTPSNLDLKYSCQFHNKHGYVVSPSLKVAKCDELLDLPKHQIGYINDEGILVHTNDNYKKQTSSSPADYEECRDCKLLPLCGGGCPIVSLNKKGSLYSSTCCINENTVKYKLINILKTMEE